VSAPTPPIIPAVMNTYRRNDIAFESGEGAWLNGSDGKRYLDFACGLAVTGLGHAHPYLVKALEAQAHKLWHVSNLFRIPEQERLAERLIAASFADVAFFCNSGAEAIEATIKVVRKYQSANGHPERFRIVTFEGAFHGRTLAALTATGNDKYLEGFGPRVDGFDQVPFGDFKAVEKAIGPETAGVLIELIQGEGGLRTFPTQFLRDLRALCDREGILLAFDEVQTGMGRTGKLFAHEWVGVTPDVMAIAKALAGGFPFGACLATNRAASGMAPGTHGSTFGGNPLGSAIANAVLDIMLEDGFFPRVQEVASHLRQSMAMLVDKYGDIFEEVRGAGMLLGFKCKPLNTDVAGAMRARGLLTAVAGDNVVRLIPPLIIDASHVTESTRIIEAACADLRASAKKEGAALKAG
jgi:acetylornithine/N-succinyldiaminopimelate aminotransferase